MKLIEYLPQDYRRSPPVVELQEALEKMLLEAEDTGEDLRAQFFLHTATWGLADWEWMYGLETDTKKTDPIRRSAILTRIMGQGTTTREVMRTVAESFIGGAVEIIEINAEYAFHIVLLETIGIPGCIAELRKAIEEIKPAHLNYDFIYRYNTWGMARTGITWGAARKRTWREMKDVKY